MLYYVKTYLEIKYFSDLWEALHCMQEGGFEIGDTEDLKQQDIALIQSAHQKLGVDSSERRAL